MKREAHKTFSLGWSALILAGMALMYGAAADAAPKLSVTAKQDTRGERKITVKGTASGVEAGSRVAIYDAATGSLLYSAQPLAKGAFTASLAAGPCVLRMETPDGGKALINVGGAACKTAVSCAIDTPAVDRITDVAVGKALAFSASSKAKGAAFAWEIGDGLKLARKIDNKSADFGTTYNTASFSHTFKSDGQYHVTLTVTDPSGNACRDDRIVRATVAGLNPHAKVAEQPRAGVAEALKAKDGSYVVLPSEETGQQGGSQIQLPYNPMIPYNNLKAQVIKKLAHKPPLVDKTEVALSYSAASSATDPAGAGSINSTSQNIFSNGQKGANVDLANSVVDPVSQAPTDNKYLPGQNYIEAKLRKSEQWDRMPQKNAATLGKKDTGYDMAWQQARYTPAKPMAKPDEGIRSYADGGEGVRKMPGISAPYEANAPQPMDYVADKNVFVAQNLPATDIDDQGRVNPYPLFRLEAAKGGVTVAKADSVYTTASETRCRECHLPGGVAADDKIWRTPVQEYELTNPDGTPGPATGAGRDASGLEIAGFAAGADPKKAWPPAIHNNFTDTHPENPTFTNLAAGAGNPAAVATLAADAKKLASLIGPNGARTDRVSATRWINIKTGEATAENAAKPTADAGDWRLQIKIKFKGAEAYGDKDDWAAQEKAALFNTLLMHDYMVWYGPTPATGKSWPASPSSQLADGYSDDDVGKSAARPQYFCAGHHQSHLKFDAGIGGKSYPTNRSDYSRAFHAFHGKMQVYKADATVTLPGGKTEAHKKGELIRDWRGHPVMFGGRGWDSQKDDDNGVPYTATDATKPAVLDKKTTQTYDTTKNNWDETLYPMHAKGELLYRFDSTVAMEDNCAKCHTGKTEKSYRDIHYAAGLKCDACHGDMLATGGVYGNEGFDANLTGAGAFGADTHAAIEPADFRRPWLDEPDCGSCHIGDANLKKGKHGEHIHDLDLYSAGALRTAWMTGDKAQRSVDPMNVRFAVMPKVEQRPELATVSGKTTYVKNPLSTALYRKSFDVHGSGANGDLACATCHGGSHAIWPNPDPKANDNVTALQLQGYAGNIAECSVCHVKDDFKTGLVATDGGHSVLGVAQGKRDGNPVSPKTTANGRAFLAGPHGLHPVNDESWWKKADGTTANKSGSSYGGWHNDMARMAGPDGEDQCAACHGNDQKGTRLSKAFTDRVFDFSGLDMNLLKKAGVKSTKVSVAAGTPVGCDTCHDLKTAKVGVPTWSAAKTHAPPPMEAISATSAGGGGGHH